jgi:amino-acid N-acetyltransferase
MFVVRSQSLVHSLASWKFNSPGIARRAISQLTEPPPRVLPPDDHVESRELILSVLRSTATKREARHYISKYKPFEQRSSFVFEDEDEDEEPIKDVLRIAVLKIRDLKSLSPQIIDGVGRTISKLSKLGISPVVFVDAGRERHDFLNLDRRPFKYYRQLIAGKVTTMADAIESSLSVRARPLGTIFESVGHGPLKLSSKDVILRPLLNNVVPVIPPIVYDTQIGEERLVTADAAIYHFVTQLAKKSHTQPTEVEKIIFVDPLGGIPSVERGNGAAHVYVNLEQELSEITAELHIGFLDPTTREIHLENLQAMKKILAELPVTSTGLITTPRVAAESSSKNPIIYNILTDRPVISPSLPIDMRRTPTLETTILRKGMPVTILFSETGLDFQDEAAKGRLNLEKLHHLINDSFGKELDLDHYMSRIKGKVAAVIIAGDYQGAAIITWESAIAEVKIRTIAEHLAANTAQGQRVAYLDKFAVLRAAQGAAGVADIMFKTMAMKLFPREILWRSRADNPVNKWYFERSKGTMKVPGSNWVMFWTGNATREKTNLGDYLKICSSIEPSFKNKANI